MAVAVVVSGLAQARSVTLTASLDGVEEQAHVRVLGPTELPTALALAPAPPR